MSEFSPKQTVYDDDGNEYIYHGEVDGMPIVAKVLYCMDYETGPYTDIGRAQELHRKLYADTPVNKCHETIAELNEKIADLRKLVDESRQELVEIQKAKNEAHQAASKYADMRLLIDWLDGKITHIIFDESYCCRVEDFDHAIENHDFKSRCEPHHKAIGLFAVPNPIENKHNPVRWKINTYKDGSGIWQAVTPCRSEEEAHSIVRERFSVRMAEFLSGERKEVVSSFLVQHPWLTPPPEYFEEVARREDAEKASKIAKLELRLQELRGVSQ